MRSAAHQFATHDVDTFNLEWAFPCVWVAPWSRTSRLESRQLSSAVNVIDEGLIDDLVNEPTVSNVYSGEHHTYHIAPEVPHDGFLADFLMRSTGMIRG